jgi:YVTN family beta-propeller protein
MKTHPSQRLLLFMALIAVGLLPSYATGATARRVTTIPVLASPHGIAADPSTNRIYVTALQSGKLQTIDGATNTVIATTTVGSNPHSLAVNLATNRVFVANNGASTVSVVDGASANVVATVPGFNSYPLGVAVDSTRNRAYVVHGGSTLSVLNGANNTIVDSIATGGSNAYVAVNSATNRAYVTKNPPARVAVLDLANGTTITDIATTGALDGIAVNEATNQIYATNGPEGVLAVIDGATNTIVGTIPVGTSPTDVAVDANRNCVYVANAGSNSVSIVNGGTRRVVATVYVGPDPKSVTVNPVTGSVYVANRGNNTVSVIHDGSCDDRAPPADRVIARKVYVLVYDPILSNGQRLSARLGWNAHAAITQGTVDFFRQVSGNRLQYTVVQTTVVGEGWPEKIDGFRYTEQEYLAVASGQAQPHQPDAVDYAKIINTPAFDICGKLNRGEIDELWVYNGPAFGFYESRLVGPNGYWFNAPPLDTGTSCNKLLPVMGPSPHVGLTNAVHNFGHRAEAVMTQVYGSWDQTMAPRHNWERFARSRINTRGAGTTSGCGDIHHPPNAAAGYEYGNPATVLSTCEDFTNYPNLGDPASTAQPTTCAAWGCSELGYYSYWFGHLPSTPGCGPDGVANDWWRYFAEPALALAPASLCPTVVLPPALAINYPNGRPGSYFTITGTNFPPNSSATLAVNGTPLAPTITTNATGGFVVIVTTAGAAPGYYVVTMTAASSASAAFTLDETQPLRARAGDGPLFELPREAEVHVVVLPFLGK